jgi:hypothetical protein
LPYYLNLAKQQLVLGGNDAHLRDLNRWYRIFSEKNHIQNLVLYETQSTPLPLPLIKPRINIGVVVAPDSSDPGLPEPVNLFPVDADHFSIVRPLDRSAEVYIHIRDFVSAPSSGAHADVLLTSQLVAINTAIEGIRSSGEAQSR